MCKDKPNRLRTVIRKKEKTELWLRNELKKSNCMVSKYLNLSSQSYLRPLYYISNTLHVDVRDVLFCKIISSKEL